VRTNLLELLAATSIAHPSAVAWIRVEAGGIRIRISGWRWWDPRIDPRIEGQIDLIFEEVSEGAIGVGESTNGHPYGDEVLEDFAVRPLSDVPWAQQASGTIYCSSALPDPFALYAILHDYLAGERAFLKPADFLNSAYSLEIFRKNVATGSYCIGSGPDVVCDLICHELERQHVVHNVIAHQTKPETRLWVTFGEQDFLCERAFAGFETETSA
jgi:hypothetical protein